MLKAGRYPVEPARYVVWADCIDKEGKRLTVLGDGDTYGFAFPSFEEAAQWVEDHAEDIGRIAVERGGEVCTDEFFRCWESRWREGELSEPPANLWAVW